MGLAAVCVAGAGLVLAFGPNKNASLELNELDELAALQLRRHLERCPECASWVAEMAAVTSLLRETPFEPVPTDMAPPTPPKADPPCTWSSSSARGEKSQRVLPRVVP